MASKRYPGLVPGTPEYVVAARRACRQRLIAELGIDEVRRLGRERIRELRAKDRKPLDEETMKRMDAAVRRRA